MINSEFWLFEICEECMTTGEPSNKHAIVKVCKIIDISEGKYEVTDGFYLTQAVFMPELLKRLLLTFPDEILDSLSSWLICINESYFESQASILFINDADIYTFDFNEWYWFEKALLVRISERPIIKKSSRPKKLTFPLKRND